MKNFDQDLKAILKAYKDGEIDIEKVMERLKTLPFEDLGHTLVDHHRVIRAGFPEVIFGEEKSVVQIKAIIASLDRRECNILVTRLSPEKAKEVLSEYPDGKYYPDAKVFTLIKREIEKKGKGLILIVTAGTSDLSVAQEAFVTAKIMGNDVEIIQDVGVSGIHRLFNYYDKILKARVLIVVAGMEGALPSVVGGLVDRPIIAVPTSVGYGASFNGLASLLGMLNSCASNVVVVNIDNGFGAGYVASLINR